MGRSYTNMRFIQYRAKHEAHLKKEKRDSYSLTYRIRVRRPIRGGGVGYLHQIRRGSGV